MGEGCRDRAEEGGMEGVTEGGRRRREGERGGDTLKVGGGDWTGVGWEQKGSDGGDGGRQCWERHL